MRQIGISTSNKENDYRSSNRGRRSAAMALRFRIARTLVAHPMKLPELEKLPQYTTWIFLDRNQRMTEDQSVVGRKQIYYDQRGEVKLWLPVTVTKKRLMKKRKRKKFRILKITFFGLQINLAWPDVSLRNHVKIRQDMKLLSEEITLSGTPEMDILKLHGCAQNVIFPAEKQCPVSLTDEEQKPCGSQCYKLVSKSGGKPTVCKEIETPSTVAGFQRLRKQTHIQYSRSKSKLVEKPENNQRNSNQLAEHVEGTMGVKQNKKASDDLDYLGNITPHCRDPREGVSLDESIRKQESYDAKCCKPFEKALIEKGVEIFGRNRRRISVKKDELNHHYEPCGCKSACEKDCLCHLSRTCCEKYCGCPRSCKNRFRGCRCAKNQYRTRQCRCVAANRECDPDVCRNCCISGGDGTFGAPPQKEKIYNCRNMKLLQKQRQKVLPRRSDVSGWGAFLKNAREKNEFIGEYTGELITHYVADKRGKIYDRTNSSFLFDLDDQLVADALRMGNKSKFANHSLNPNCYGKTDDRRFITLVIFKGKQLCWTLKSNSIISLISLG